MGGDDPGQQLADGQPAVDGRASVAPGLSAPAVVPSQLFGCAINGAGQFQSFAVLAIPTGPAVVSQVINVAGLGPFLYDVDVTTFLTHTFAADLDITIRSPAGTVVTLTTDNGAGNDNVFNNTLWDDDANPGGQVPYVTNNGMATEHAYVDLTTASPLAPEEPLGAFFGENPNGNWTITISDDLAGDGGSLNIWRLNISTLATSPAVFTTIVANNNPLVIPTGPGVVSSQINISGAGTTLSDVDLTTFIAHTFAADLDITLRSPAGTIVTLTTDNGSGNDNVFNGTVWNDRSNVGGQVPYVTNNGIVTDHAFVNLTLASPLAPEEGLAAFIDENPNGTWTLTISDDLAGDGGTLTSWSLDIDTRSCTLPAGVVDNYAAAFGTQLNVPAPGVLNNDSSNGGGFMTAALVTAPASGALVLNANGSFQYTPAAGFVGPVSFTYRPSTSVGLGNVTTANITVNPGVPTTAQDDLVTPYLTTLTLAAPGVLGNDVSNGGGAMTATLVAGPSHGSLTLNANGSFSYTPNVRFAGVDGFTYRAANSVGQGNVAIVRIDVANPTTVQPPYNLRVWSVAGNTVTFRWDVWPVGPQASTFVLEGGLGPGDVLASISTDNAAPIYTIVVPTGSFYARIHAQLGADKSGPSNEVPLYVNVPVPPTAPAGLLGLSDGSTLALTWKNTFEGGAATGMMLDVTGSLTASVPIPATGPFVFSPVPDGNYTFTLRPTNGGGIGAASTSVTLDFPAPCAGVPGRPVNVLAYRVGNTGYVVWDPPPTGPALTGYVLSVSGSYVGSFPTTGRVLSGVVAPGTYDLSLVATNACGSSTAVTTSLVVP